jgi:hypothetical protein
MCAELDEKPAGDRLTRQKANHFEELDMARKQIEEGGAGGQLTGVERHFEGGGFAREKDGDRGDDRVNPTNRNGLIGLSEERHKLRSVIREIALGDDGEVSFISLRVTAVDWRKPIKTVKCPQYSQPCSSTSLRTICPL